jgi:hypothetical protein
MMVGAVALASPSRLTPSIAEHSVDMQDRFRRIGEVKFNAIAPAKITSELEMQEVTTFFRKEKRKWGGRSGLGRLVTLAHSQLFLNTAPIATASSQVLMDWSIDGTLEVKPRDP